MKILLIITGSIAAYKSCEIIRLLQKNGHCVQVIMTKGATQFLQPLTVSALTQNHVYGELFSLTDESDMGHIRLARDADAVLVAPASADFMAKIAMGIADDLASTVILATQAPIWIAPAMNPQMYANAATQHNITVLQNRGINIIPPDTGEAACGEHGIGRMSDPQQIIDIITKKSHPLNNKIILLTVGATREAIDPIRFISNGSSGQMGYAMALVAAQMGAKVTVLEAHTSHPRPVHHNITFEKTSSAEEMLNASLYHTKNTMFDYAVFVAAVADFTPENYSPQKLDKQKLSQISLRHTVDILNKIATLPTQQRPKKVIGFAAQTDHVITKAKQKLLSKNCDAIFANEHSSTIKAFDSEDNQLFFIDKNNCIPSERMKKQKLAQWAWERIVDFLEVPII